MAPDNLHRKALKIQRPTSEPPPGASEDLNNHTNHHPPSCVMGVPIAFPHKPKVYSQVVLPEPLQATGYPTPYLHAPCPPTTQGSLDHPGMVVAPALTLPSFRELVQGVELGAQPRVWAGPQPLDQQSLDNTSSPDRELLTGQNFLATARGSSPRSTNEGEIDPRAPGAQRKRTRTPDLSSVSPQPLRRRRGAEVHPPSNISREVVMSGDTSFVPPSPPQPRSSGRKTYPIIVEVQMPRPFEGSSSTTHHTRQTNGGELFTNASNTVIKDSNMIAIGSIQQVYTRNDNLDDAAALRLLREHAMRGAEYDSADRDPPPRCHPGTRTTIIQNIQDWLGNSEREKNLLWLRGTAGVGKSAIIQTLAESLSGAGRLGASLFFSRPNGRSNPRQILSTLAYRFAAQNSWYREYITQLLQADPETLDKAMNEQFRILIIEPFVRKGIRSGTEDWVVVLDGLDECDGDPNGRRHSNDVQCDVVRLISNSIRQYPTAPLIWIIASRPETHLKAVFSEQGVVSSVWEEDVPVDSDEACEDVEKFLHKEFTKISEKYPDHIQDSPWPTNAQFLKIAHAALGLFIFAEVVVRFVDDPDVGNPIAQLDCVLLAISKMRSKKNGENPLVNLDAIYIAILSKIPPGTLPITRRLLGFLIFLTTTNYKVSDCNFRLICKILDVSEDVAVTALRHLHSVLYFPRSKEIGDTRPRFYHASFRDLLEDKSRSHEYFIDKRAVMAESIQSISRVAQVQFSSDSKHKGEPGNFISIFLERVFYGDFSLGGVRLKSGRNGWITGSLPDPQFQLLLESLSAIRVIKYAPGAFYSYHWCSEKRDDHELSRRGFLSWTTFGSLSVNWDTVSISTSILSGFHLVDVDKTAGTRAEPHLNNPEAQEIRRIFKTAAPDTEARIWGHKKSNCHVVVVILRLELYALTGVL